MKRALGLFVLMLLAPAAASATCPPLSLTKDFLAPLETPTTQWAVKQPHYYPYPELGFSIHFETRDTFVDFYIYDAGIKNFDAEIIEQEFGHSVMDMLQVYTAEENSTISSPFFVPDGLVAGLNRTLVLVAAYAGIKRQTQSMLSIVSMGFDGRCFQKIRFTKKLPPEINIEDYSEDPGENGHARAAIYDFARFTTTLGDELYRIGYYK